MTVGRPISVPGPVADLARALGGMRKLCEEIGVTHSTPARWASGKGSINQPTLQLLIILFRAHGITDGVEAFVKKNRRIPTPTKVYTEDPATVRLLLEARAQSGFNQSELGQLLERTQEWVSKLENGSLLAPKGMIPKWLKACGLPEDWRPGSSN